MSKQPEFKRKKNPDQKVGNRNDRLALKVIGTDGISCAPCDADDLVEMEFIKRTAADRAQGYQALMDVVRKAEAQDVFGQARRAVAMTQEELAKSNEPQINENLAMPVGRSIV